VKICPSTEPQLESHNWDRWEAYGGEGKDGFFFYRDCMNFGCWAEQRTEMLAPQGKTEVRLMPGWDQA
jgi:hypothetical protein